MNAPLQNWTSTPRQVGATANSAPENLVYRDFTAVAPNEKGFTDITEFQIPVGKVYLSPTD